MAPQAVVDRLHLVGLARRQHVAVRVALIGEQVRVVRVAVRPMRVEVIVEEQVARRSVGHASLHVGLDQLLPALLGPLHGHWPIDPRLILPQHDEPRRVRVELRLLDVALAAHHDHRRRRLHQGSLVPCQRRRVGAPGRRRRLRTKGDLPGALALRESGSELVDRDTLGPSHLVRDVHVVDKGERHLVDVGALPRQEAAILRPLGWHNGGGRWRGWRGSGGGERLRTQDHTEGPGRLVLLPVFRIARDGGELGGVLRALQSCVQLGVAHLALGVELRPQEAQTLRGEPLVGCDLHLPVGRRPGATRAARRQCW
eukprot:scaffold127092_cov30-Phaeocystis_antarctica.AAC.1